MFQKIYNTADVEKFFTIFKITNSKKSRGRVSIGWFTLPMAADSWSFFRLQVEQLEPTGTQMGC